MRRLLVWNLMTLDGYFEGAKSWDLAFHEKAWGKDLENFSMTQAEEVGALLFGRITYEGMAAYWTDADGPIADFMNGVRKYVASRTLASADWNNSFLLEGDLPDAVAALKARDGKDIYVFGSADLCAELLKLGLVDEYRVCIAPVVLGAGKPLFAPGGSLDMTLIDARPIDTGGVILRYAPATP